MTNDPIRLQIEKVVYGGDGLGRLPASENGQRLTAFVPFTLPGEDVSAWLAAPEKSLVRGELAEVLQAAPERVAPPCPYFARCGGCQLQHGRYQWQIAAKRAMLEETFARAGVPLPPDIAVIHGEPLGYRSRIRLHVSAKPVWRLGYLQRRSHKLLAVEQCPIASPLLHRVLRALQDPEVSLHAPQSVTGIELFADPDDAAFLLTASGTDKSAKPNEFRKWMHALAAAAPELQGAVLHAIAPGQTPRLLSAFGKPALRCGVGPYEYRVSAGAFFQGNRLLLKPLVEAVTAAVLREQPPTAEHLTLWDLYAGVGLFSVPLALHECRVEAVEGAPISGADLQHNLRETSAVCHAASVESFLQRDRTAPDCVLVDPPRTGLGKQVAQALARRVKPKRMVYLSCDPVTLARDARVLLDADYRIESATLFDLFPQTFHMETLVTLTRG